MPGIKTLPEKHGLPLQLDLRVMLVLLGLTLLAAVGFKALDDWRTERAHLSAMTEREALAVSEYVNGKVESVAYMLGHARRSGWGSRQTQQSHPDIDSIIGLADALSAAEGSRARSAGEVASQLLANDRIAGLTSAGDIVVVHKSTNTSARIALIKAETWTPVGNGGRHIFLSAIDQDVSKTNVNTTCKAISLSLHACVANSKTFFTWVWGVDLMAYALLLISPGIIIIGLWQRVSWAQSAHHAIEGEVTTAGRLLDIVQKETISGYWTWQDGSREIWLSEPAAILIGLNQSDFYKPDVLTRSVHSDYVEVMGQVFETFESREYLSQTFALSDNKTWLDIRASRDPVTNTLHGVLIDVTMTKRAIQRSQQAEQRLKSSIEGFTGPFAIWDRNKRLLYWNTAFSSVFGLGNSLRVGMSYETVKLAQASGIRARRGKREGGTNVIRAQDDDWYKFVERMTPTGGMISVGLNVTADVQNEVKLDRQRKQLETVVGELKEAQKAAAQLAHNLEIERD
ncbi:MAG: PAS domain-containing protein, partial [Pseudomonadota bacterium]